ncbi:MAG: hypothetical protein CMG74_03055 [Candidatus Marinimicrobia bacterium]|nr:hypothetical protein [Candidatus Neomarinimicrobiota bacterium]|tara:strand:- start:8426 stop:9052 length:627 start_codon:yes stop_codon:yes gene_type:complete
MQEREFSTLLKILDGEQQIIQRTDQKAFTMLSLLGVFMVFFIVHFTKMQMDTLIFLLIVVYFPAAMGALYFLVRVIVPRVRNVSQDAKDLKDKKLINPTFFGGISQFQSAEDYGDYLKKMTKDENQLYEMFAGQVFALGRINARKNENVRKAMFFLAAALTSELLIIMTLAYRRAYSYLSENTFYYALGVLIFSILLIIATRSKMFPK